MHATPPLALRQQSRPVVSGQICRQGRRGGALPPIAPAVPAFPLHAMSDLPRTESRTAELREESGVHRQDSLDMVERRIEHLKRQVREGRSDIALATLLAAEQSLDSGRSRRRGHDVHCAAEDCATTPETATSAREGGDATLSLSEDVQGRER